jgi:hypothetical protein
MITLWAGHCEVNELGISLLVRQPSEEEEKSLRALFNIMQCYSLLSVRQPHD